MRDPIDRSKLDTFMEVVGKAATSPGKVYFVGGSTALLLGFRPQTIDIDIKLHPEPGGVFEAISQLKEQFDMNVELAAPDDFIPSLPGWEGRSEFIAKSGLVDFFHYDFYGQCLAKIQRGHSKDLGDARAFVREGKIGIDELRRLFEAIQPDLIKYPGVDAGVFRDRFEAFAAEVAND